MKQVIVNSREELNKLLDALDVTEQYYAVEKMFMMKETGLTTTSEILPTWSVAYGEPPHEEEESNLIGFRPNEVEFDEEIDEDYDEEEIEE